MSQPSSEFISSAAEVAVQMENPAFIKIMQSFLRTINNEEEKRKFEEDMSKLDEMVISFENPPSGIEKSTKQLRWTVPENAPAVERLVPEKWFSIACNLSKYRDYQHQPLQAFINFEWSERIDDPWTDLVCSHSASDHHHDESTSTGSHAHGHHHFQIPYVLDRAFKSNKMKIFDFAVGRKAMRWARHQTDFLDTLIETALQAIEETFQESVDRQSVRLVRETDYVFPPSSITQIQDPPPPTTIPLLFPHILRKLGALTGVQQLKMSPTGLTDTQRALLRPPLPAAHKEPPFLFSHVTTALKFQDTLKIYIPALNFEQTEGCITVWFTISSTALKLSWNLLPISLQNDPIEGECTPHHGCDEDNIHSLEVHFLDPSSQEYAFSATFYGPVLQEASYLTISNDRVVAVIKKQTPSIWPRILRESTT